MKGIIGVDIGGTNINAALVIDGKIKTRIKLAPAKGWRLCLDFLKIEFNQLGFNEILSMT